MGAALTEAVDLSRLSDRKTKIWHQNYLIYKFLWPNILWAVNSAKAKLTANSPVVLDIGCGEKPYKDLFEHCYYVGLNHSLTDADPDVVGDATVLPIGDGAVDMVFTTQVIEHVAEPQAMIDECFRVLKPGGVLVLTGPFYWPIHEEPYDFYRYTRYGLEHLVKKAGFDSWEIRPDGGDWVQIFLSINLKIPRVLFPLRIMVNMLGLIGEWLSDDCKVPPNYTMVAIRQK